MKTYITTVSIQILQLESEGIDPVERLSSINKQIIKIRQKLEVAWKKFADNPTEELEAEIDTLLECLHDYEEEFNYIMGEDD